GADVNAKNDQGGTPLHVTAGSNCDARVLQFLITHGADINTKDNEGATPLHSAALLNDKGETVQFLISQGADVHAKDTGDMTPLHWAVGRKNDIKIAKIFGEDANTKADGGCTSLHLAELLEFNVDVVQSLVSQGADVNAKDDEGDTPLHWAARSHHGDDNVRFVVEGDNAHARDDIGGATRLVEESQKIVEIARLLISHGASVQAKNKKGQTPLDLAKEKNNVTLTEYLSGITEQMETAFPPTPTTQ
ncbi:MAG TPA: hypothetical protein DEB39_03305, partial [Planctomycetaceae bacterium]|nr:hypothetical protein [Planctomycetaceae bacterium]